MTGDPVGVAPQGPEGHAKRPAEGLLVAPRRPITRYRPAVIAAGLGAIVLVIGAGFIVGLSGGQTRRTVETVPKAPANR